MPHCVTGFAPFELMFGRDVKGPLELMRSSWVDRKVDGLRLCDWVKEVRQKMSAMAKVVRAVADLKIKKGGFRYACSLLFKNVYFACSGASNYPFDLF